MGVARPEGNDGGSLPYLVAVREIEAMDALAFTERRELVIGEEVFDELKALFDDGWVGTEARLEADGSAVTLILTK